MSFNRYLVQRQSIERKAHNIFLAPKFTHVGLKKSFVRYLTHTMKRKPYVYDIKTVAVIGAGSAGIAAARYLIAEKAFKRVTIFEQRTKVGGMWNYTTPPSADWKPLRMEYEDEFITPIYDELESNIPKSLMQYSELPFPEDTPVLPSHASVLKYLTEYAEPVKGLINFRTQVVEVSAASGSQWSVTTRSLDSRETTTETYDAVVVANGHFEIPSMPAIKGLEAWMAQYPGSVLHSMSYRRATAFRDKKVIVVGTGASGSEIATHLESTCKQTIIISKRSHVPSHNDSSDRVVLPAIVELRPEDRAVCFANGQIEKDVDHIIFCTGYLCHFPFLPQAPTLYDCFCTRNLYRNMFYIPQPTLAFVAMPLKSVPFPISESQGAVVARIWSNRLALPNQANMKSWDEAFLLKNGDHKPSPLEAAHFNVSLMNELYDWSLQAKRRNGLENRGQGKLPPRWGEKEIWIRERLGPIKAAFTACGEARRGVKTLEQLGFSFGEWKQNKSTSGQVL